MIAGTAEIRRWGPPLAVLAVVAAVFLPLTPAYDVDVFLRAGRAALDGGPVYPAPGSPAVYSGFSFVYPYFAVWPFVPLAALLSSGAAETLFFLICAGLVIAAALGTADRDPVKAALVLGTTFTITGLQLGSLSPLLFAGVVFLWRVRDRPVAFGLLAAPVIASKLFLLPLLAWPLLARRYRALAWATVSSAVLLLAGFIVGPLSLAQYARMVSELGLHEARAGFGLIAGLRDGGVSASPAQAVSLGLAAAVFLAAFTRHRRTGDERVLFAAGIVVSLLISPVVWSHYLVLLAAALIALDAARVWLFGLAAASWVIAPPHGTDLHASLPTHLASPGPWLGVLASLLVFGLAARSARVSSEPPAG